jgi:hypothetical protein
MQRVEIGNAVETTHQGLTVDDELLYPVLQRGLHDPRGAASPIIAAARDQAYACTITL